MEHPPDERHAAKCSEKLVPFIQGEGETSICRAGRTRRGGVKDEREGLPGEGLTEVKVLRWC